MMLTRTLASTVCAAALLGGCATTPSQPPSSAPVAPYQDSLSVSGRLTVRYVKDGSQQSSTVNFGWKQDAQRTDVTLYSPLGGSTLATLAVTPQSATLTEGGKPPRSAPDIDTLTARALGWALPVSGLRGWLQGHATAADGRPFAASPANNSVTTAGGWRLQYVTWQEGALPPKPKRIDAEHPGGGDIQEMSLRIVLDAEE